MRIGWSTLDTGSLPQKELCVGSASPIYYRWAEPGSEGTSVDMVQMLHLLALGFSV